MVDDPLAPGPASPVSAPPRCTCSSQLLFFNGPTYMPSANLVPYLVLVPPSRALGSLYALCGCVFVCVPSRRRSDRGHEQYMRAALLE